MTFTKIAIIDPVGIKAGLDHYDVSLAKSLNDLSLDVKVYSNFESNNSKIVERTFAFFIESSSARVVQTCWSFLWSLRRSFKEKREIVILHVFHFSIVDYLFIRIIKMFKMKAFLIVHDINNLVENKNSGWLKECVNHSDKIIVHNNFSLDELKSRVDQEIWNRIFVIPHGNYVDHGAIIERSEAIRKLNLDPAKRYILFFGMIKKSKGLDDLIRSMVSVDENINLVIAGRPRDVSVEEINRGIKKLNLGSRIHLFPGYLSNEERNLFFNAADAVVLPYHRIYQSGVMIMAMSFGKVVIASDLPVNKAMLNENAGILFKTGNSSDLAQKINSLSKIDMTQIQSAALKYISEKNNWTSIANEFANIMRK